MTQDEGHIPEDPEEGWITGIGFSTKTVTSGSDVDCRIEPVKGDEIDGDS